MTHEMDLNPGPFELIKSGRKVIEMRLYDERRKDIQVGDSIVFTNNETGERLSVDVINLYRFSSFEELYQNFDKTKLGYSPDEPADPKDMELYYSKERIQQYGVLGIEIRVR